MGLNICFILINKISLAQCERRAFKIFLHMSNYFFWSNHSAYLVLLIWQKLHKRNLLKWHSHKTRIVFLSRNQTVGSQAHRLLSNCKYYLKNSSASQTIYEYVLGFPSFLQIKTKHSSRLSVEGGLWCTQWIKKLGGAKQAKPSHLAEHPRRVTHFLHCWPYSYE